MFLFCQIYNINILHKKIKTPSDRIDDNMDITGIKLKYLSEKKNDYGTNHLFELLDVKPLKDLVESKEKKKI